MLARALALEPRVLLLDEPTSALDEDAGRDRGDARCTCASACSVSFVLVTHDLDQARAAGDWVVRLDEGRPRWPGPGRGAAAPVILALTSSSIDVSIGEVAATLVLVALAVGGLALAAGRPRAGHRDRGAAVVPAADRDRLRHQCIFDQDSLCFVFALIAVMVVFGAFTARGRRARSRMRSCRS